MAWTQPKPLPRNWRTIATQILTRDRYRCRIAGPTCLGVASTVDHIVCRAEGGGHEPGNLQAACTPCHDIKTKAEAARGRARAPKARREPERHPGQTPTGGPPTPKPSPS